MQKALSWGWGTSQPSSPGMGVGADGSSGKHLADQLNGLLSNHESRVSELWGPAKCPEPCKAPGESIPHSALPPQSLPSKNNPLAAVRSTQRSG